MSDAVVSLIRTYTPIALSAVLVWLADLGVGVSEEASAGLIAGVVAVTAGLYYAAVRWGESRWRWLGLLLGSRRQPTYTPPS